MKSGVYLIHCKANGRTYIGSAVSFQKRWAVHRHELRHKFHHSKHLQRAWNKYGESAFKFVVAELCEPSRLIEREQCWLDSFEKSMKFNTATIAGNTLGVASWNKGLTACYSKETISKMSAAKKGKVLTDENKLALSIKMKAVRKANPWSTAKKAA
jgi:group I intron endonuclease